MFEERRNYYETGPMVSRNKEKEPVKRPSEVQPINERHPSSWVQKYLDLADVLMKSRKHKRQDRGSKAA